MTRSLARAAIAGGLCALALCGCASSEAPSALDAEPVDAPVGPGGDGAVDAPTEPPVDARPADGAEGTDAPWTPADAAPVDAAFDAPPVDAAPPIDGCAPSGSELCGTGIDEDCDGSIDEGFPLLGMPCSVGVGACAASGSYVCSSSGLGVVCSAVAGSPGTETCNGVDDDCDGVTDEGTTEICNGVDDDCDGSIDEGFGVGSSCDGSDGDLCPEGAIACNAAGGTVCSDTSPTNSELCNGVDDDCDGSTDEGYNLGDACDGTDSDSCNEGVIVCNGFGGAMCSDTTGPSVESCNGLDDDCVGGIDDPWPSLGSPCSVGIGACARSGSTVCTSDGTGTTCSVVADSPSAETCGDGIDSNCDGSDGVCPPNDTAAGATDISSGGTFTADLSAANNDATADCAGSFGGRDVYYTFFLPSPEVVYLDTFGSDFDTVLRLYAGSCTALGALQQCVDDSCATLQTQVATQLGAGTYCLIVDQYSSSWTTGALTLRFLRGGRTGTSIATGSGTYTGSTCGNPNTTTPECPFISNAPDVAYWFTMCPADSRTVSANTCTGTTWDSVLYLRTGASGSAPSTACNDDSCGLQSSISASVSGANLYWLIVDGYSTACGSYSLAVTM